MKDKILVIDNYDSFTYNLVHAIEFLCKGDVTVRRNDQINLEEVDQFEILVFSPGPGLPDEAGIMKELIQEYYKTKKMLGVCLGLQAMAEVFGGKLMNLKQVFHGIKSEIYRNETESKLFLKIPEKFEAGRYHSWVIDPQSLPAELNVTSTDDQNEIMSIEHTVYPIYGVQFHPESIMTPLGNQILSNFLFNC